ncbi:MAG: hypothetical protein ACRYGR_05390 [Janthinobacterium lividum]
MFSLKSFFIFGIFFGIISIQPVYNSEITYGTYQFSDDCMRCLNEDSFAKQKTIQEQENACLQQELQKIQEKFVITLDFVLYSMNIYSKNSDIDEDIKKVWQKRISYLKKSSADFLTFVEKFCDDNRRLHGVRNSNIIYYYEMIDLINTRLHHLQNDDLNIFSSLTHTQLDDLLTAILDGILTSSKDHLKLTHQEDQKIDIFLKLSKFLSRPESRDAISTDLLNRLKKLHTQENNLVALALYNKIKSYF